MKNGNMLQGGSLLQRIYQAWQIIMQNSLKLTKEGMPIWSLTIQNEPI
jgi:O-glycosyl hydrolase